MVNYRLAAHIERVLASGALAACHVVLVDNASEPEKLTALARRYGADLLLLDRNVGFAAAVNRAVDWAGKHAQVLLLNPDVHVDEADLAVLKGALAADDLTGVSPLLVGQRGVLQGGMAGGVVTAWRLGAYFLFLTHLFPKWRGAFYTRRQVRSGVAPAWISMACLLLRGDAFERFGPITEHETVYAEDLAWGVAATAAGARFRVLRDVNVLHEGGASGASSEWSRAVIRYVVREQGRARGYVASACMWVGLVLRRLVGRPVVFPVMRRRSRRGSSDRS